MLDVALVSIFRKTNLYIEETVERIAKSILSTREILGSFIQDNENYVTTNNKM
jgi:hypothetical protein